MQSGSKRILLIAGAVVLTAALYFAPQKVKQDDAKESNEPFSFESLLTEAKGQLKRQEADQFTAIEKELSKDPSSVILTDSLGKMWDRQNMPQISSHYFEMVAEKSPGETNWINAAYRYYDAFRITSDSILRNMFVEKAITTYKKVLEINPENLDAKTDLALCYAEGTSNPMQGIMMLREVVEKKPEHEMAQYNLGILSLKSGQNEKAIDRFQKVLQINSSNKEARFLLGRTYAMMGKKDLAIENLEMIKNTDNKRLDDEVNTLINQIINN
jgi:tetratricopeptide (TPR) repeat protein